MQNQNNTIELQKALIEGANINVPETNHVKDFLILIAGMCFIVLAVIMSFGFISDVFVTYMPDSAQMKIERLLTLNENDYKVELQYQKELERLNKIKRRIVRQDSSLNNKSALPVYIYKNENVNAFITPSGNIYVTTEAVKQRYSDEELTFILAHEVGHYAHRDHLRMFSRTILIEYLFSAFFQDSSLKKIVNGITDMESLSHSRKQEKEADKYAGLMLYKIYGRNKGGVDFINKIKEKEKNPEFLYYFSTHPSWNERLELLNKQKKMLEN